MYGNAQFQYVCMVQDPSGISNGFTKVCTRGQTSMRVMEWKTNCSGTRRKAWSNSCQKDFVTLHRSCTSLTFILQLCWRCQNRFFCICSKVNHRFCPLSSSQIFLFQCRWVDWFEKSFPCLLYCLLQRTCPIKRSSAIFFHPSDVGQFGRLYTPPRDN